MKYFKWLFIAALITFPSLIIKASPIHDFSRRGETNKLLLKLIENPAIVNEKEEDGNTPLHLAAGYKRNGFGIFFHSDYSNDILFGNLPGMVRILILFGADVDARNNMGMTPLHLSSSLNNYKVTEILIENGADINVRDDQGRTPMHWVSLSRKSQAGVARLLIEHGAQINLEDEDGFTPLHDALSWCSIEIAELLIINGADINSKTKAAVSHSSDDLEDFVDSGMTPLHLASYCNSIEIADLLIEHGADVNAKTSKGFTPLEIAKVVNLEYADYLRHHGAFE